MTEKSQKKENRGGKRAGAGRKPGYSPGREALSVRQAKEFEATARKLAKEFGMTMQEVIGRQVYDAGASRKDIQTAVNLFWKYSVIGAAEGGEDDKSLGPSVFLPEQHPRLEVIEGGKKDDEEKDH